MLTSQRTAVTGLGLVIFLLWTGYRNVTNMWPFQVLLFTCVGVVMLRYSPMNSIRAVGSKGSGDGGSSYAFLEQSPCGVQRNISEVPNSLKMKVRV